MYQNNIYIQNHEEVAAMGGDMIPCTWPPDTAGMWQWVLVSGGTV